MIKFISSEPRLALALASRKRPIMPDDVHEFVNGWIFDIGTELRRRDVWVSNIANLIVSQVLNAVA